MRFQILSLTLAFMNQTSLIVGFSNTLLMPSLKSCSTWTMPMDGTLVFLKKYNISEVTKKDLFLVIKALQKPCQ